MTCCWHIYINITVISVQFRHLLNEISIICETNICHFLGTSASYVGTVLSVKAGKGGGEATSKGMYLWTRGVKEFYISSCFFSQ